MAFSDPAQLEGRSVMTADGDKIGTVDTVFVDTGTQQPEWVTVSTGMFGRKVSFVPLAAASPLPDGNPQVPFDREKIKGAPHHDADRELSPGDEAGLFSYYGIPYGGESVTATSGPATGAGDVGRDTSLRGEGDGSSRSEGDGSSRGEGYDRSPGEGYDTSGPNTDDAMTRSEERLRVGTETIEAGRARLRKYVVTEQVTQTVPVSHEEVRIEREPITEADAGAALDGPDISEEEHEVVLTAETPVVAKETVPVERVRLGTETVTDEQTVTEDVRREEIDLNDGQVSDRVRR